MDTFPTPTLLHLQVKLYVSELAVWSLKAQRRGYPRKFGAEQFCTKFTKKLEFYERLIMPRQKKAKTFTNDLQFARVDLTTDEAMQFEKWLKTGEFDIGQLLLETLTRGESLSIKYNADEDSFFCTLIGRDESEHNAGKGFTSWAHHPDVALLLTLYKYHYVIDRIIKLDKPSNSELSFG